MPTTLTVRADVSSSGSVAAFWMRLAATVRLEWPRAGHGICPAAVRQPTNTPPKTASMVLFDITRSLVNAPSRPSIDGRACRVAGKVTLLILLSGLFILWLQIRSYAKDSRHMMSQACTTDRGHHSAYNQVQQEEDLSLGLAHKNLQPLIEL